MTTAEFRAICRGVESGGEHFVEDRTTHMVGKVVSCRGSQFDVDVEQERQSWPSATCREKWTSNK